MLANYAVGLAITLGAIALAVVSAVVYDRKMSRRIRWAMLGATVIVCGLALASIVSRFVVIGNQYGS